MPLDLRIELPAYSHSFNVHVPSSSTIYEVKQEISQTCPGKPRIEGQRLIWRGKNLGNHERVDDLWKSPADSRTLHLAVHPSAWTSDLPTIPQSTPVLPLNLSLPTPVSSSTLLPNTFNAMWMESPTRTSPILDVHRPIPYVVAQHQSAVQALISGDPPSLETNAELRQAAVAAVERAGWNWPDILDARYPVASTGGLKYERVSIGGRPYLSLQNPNASPTPVQLHALQVLSNTFTLLSLHVTATVTRTDPSYTLDNVPPNINQVLQQLGLPPLRVAPNHNLDQDGIAPQLRELPLRPLLMPLMLLIFRTMLLLYFVAPARKPIFGILILAWMLYEIWQPIRNGLLRGLNRVAANPAQPNPNPAAPNRALPRNDQPLPPRPPMNIQGQGPLAVGRLDMHAGAIFDTLAHMNIQTEEAIMAQAHNTAFREPGLGQKIASFFGLLFSTLHPAIWNRRRIALRRREGVIRTQANIRNAADQEPEEDGQGSAGEHVDSNATVIREELRVQHARRPEWIQRYIARVVEEEWVDDLD